MDVSVFCGSGILSFALKSCEENEDKKVYCLCPGIAFPQCTPFSLPSRKVHFVFIHSKKFGGGKGTSAGARVSGGVGEGVIFTTPPCAVGVTLQRKFVADCSNPNENSVYELILYCREIK